MSKFSDFSYSPYTNSTNSQFNPALYNNKGANAGCVGTKNMAGGSNITTSSFYGLKSVDADTASVKALLYCFYYAWFICTCNYTIT